MSTWALATIIACVTIVVLTVLVLWLRQAKKAKPDMYAMAAETIVNNPVVGRTIDGRRIVGKHPALGYGYRTKGRPDQADILGAVAHPSVSLGFGMDEFPLHSQEPLERDCDRQD